MPCVPKGDNLKSYPFFYLEKSKIIRIFKYEIKRINNSINVIGSDDIRSKAKVSNSIVDYRRY